MNEIVSLDVNATYGSNAELGVGEKGWKSRYKMLSPNI